MDEERHNIGWWMDSTFPFDRTKAFLDEAGACAYAYDLAKDCPVLEYGVLLLDARPMNFSGC